MLCVKATNQEIWKATLKIKMPKQNCESMYTTYSFDICSRHQSVWGSTSFVCAGAWFYWWYVKAQRVDVTVTRQMTRDILYRSTIYNNSPIVEWFKWIFDFWVGFGSKSLLDYEYYHVYWQLTYMCLIQDCNRYEQIILVHTFPFQKYQVIHQQYFSLSSVTKIPHWVKKKKKKEKDLEA